MTNSKTTVPENYIVEWNYTKNEWKNFEKWNSRQKTIFHFLQFLFFPNTGEAPKISFTRTSIVIDGKARSFNGPLIQVKKVNISNNDLLNILTISYENLDQGKSNEINIPVPRGKLKEAIQLQNQLMEESASIG
jgi:hypothetical protein